MINFLRFLLRLISIFSCIMFMVFGVVFAKIGCTYFLISSILCALAVVSVAGYGINRLYKEEGEPNED